MDLLSGYSDNALSGFNGYTPQANAAYNNSMSGQNANLAYVGGQDQSVLNQIYYDMMTKGPSSGYGTVGGYPSFGEARNYGGQNDPFSGGYAPGNQGYSGVPVQTQAPANNPYDPYADRMDAAPQYDMDAYRRALAETMAAQQPQQPQSYLPDYTGSAFPGFYGQDRYQDPNPFGGGAQVNFPTLQNNDPYSALSTWRQPGGDSGTATWGGQPMDSGGGGSTQTPGEKSWADWLKQYQMPVGPQPGEGSMNPSADWLRGQLTPKQPTPDISSGDSFYNQPQSWGDWFKQYQMPAGPQPGDTSMSPAFDAMRKYFTPEQASTPNGQAAMEEFYKTNYNQLQQGGDPFGAFNGGQVGGGYNPYAGITGTEGSNNVPKDSPAAPSPFGPGYDLMRQMQQQQAPVDTRGSQGWGIGGIENYLRQPGQGPTQFTPSPGNNPAFPSDWYKTISPQSSLEGPPRADLAAMGMQSFSA